MKRMGRGFTLIELIVVIAVIGVLATITIVGLTRYQATSRDTQRASKATVIAEALEKYYDQNGEYPSCSVLTQDAETVSKNTLKGIDSKALLTPTAANAITTSLQCTDLTSASGSDIFAYVGDGSEACRTGASCLRFTLKYKDESNNSVDAISSRRNTNITTSNGIINLSGSAIGFTSINLSWSAVTNASSYKVQRATNSLFTGNTETSVASVDGVDPMSSAFGGLTQNTTYYFRVAPVAPDSVGAWSNTFSIATWNLAKPVITTTPNSTSAITVNWSAVDHADSYTLSYSLSSTMSSPTTVTGISKPTTSKQITGLAAGTTYYFQLQAVASGWTGTDNSDVKIGATQPNPVASCTVNTTNSTTLSASWTNVTGATSYAIQYATNSSFTGASSGTATGTPYSAGSLSQGQKYWIRVYSVANGVQSGTAPSCTGITSINQPGAPYIYGFNNGSGYGTTTWDWADLSCPAGTSPYYSIRFADNANNSWSGYYNVGVSYGTNGATNSQGVSYKAGVIQECTSPYTSSPWSNESENGWYYFPISHFQIAGAALRIANDHHPQIQLMSYNGGCAAGTAAEIYIHKQRDNVDYSTGWEGFAGNGQVVAFVNDMNQVGSKAELFPHSRCRNVTTNYVTDASGYGDAGAQYNYGDILIGDYTYNGVNHDKMWRVSCPGQPANGYWCDTRYTVAYSGNSSNASGNYVNTGPNCGYNSSTFRTLGSNENWSYRQGC